MPKSRGKLIYVDGLAVRDTLDDDFNVLHMHPHDGAYFFEHRLYIPREEIWLDYRYKAETDFLVAVQFFMEDNGIPNHTPYSEVRKMTKDRFGKRGTVPDFVRERKRDGQYSLVGVDGKLVREYIDTDFFAGGHHLVYDYVPDGELWYDMLLDAKEVPDVLLHERVEFELMKQGKNYDIAHEYARTNEREARRARGGAYPGDVNYPWHGLTLEEIIKKYYVV